MINQWAADHGIAPAAVRDLFARLGALEHLPGAPTGSEAAAQKLCQLEASRQGARLWRNNVGATTTDTGQHIRYGLCNESARVNARLKSSDLIGIRPVVITPAHVGSTIGQFIAREIKKPGWVFRQSDKRAVAQASFLALVTSLGGDAKFSTGELDSPVKAG